MVLSQVTILTKAVNIFKYEKMDTCEVPPPMSSFMVSVLDIL